jgi:hypothetical protein
LPKQKMPVRQTLAARRAALGDVLPLPGTAPPQGKMSFCKFARVRASYRRIVSEWLVMGGLMACVLCGAWEFGFQARSFQPTDGHGREVRPSLLCFFFLAARSAIFFPFSLFRPLIGAH